MPLFQRDRHPQSAVLDDVAYTPFVECDRDGNPLPDHLQMRNQPSVWENCVPTGAGLRQCPNCGSTLTTPAISCRGCGMAVGMCPARVHVVLTDRPTSCCTSGGVAA